ncbi:DNA alkylation repair protein [Aerococcaceae bacterium WGS1372]
MEYRELFEELRANRTENARAMFAYLRNQFPFLGLKSGKRREITRPYLKQAKQEARQTYKENPNSDIIDWDFVHSCWQQEEREFQYIAADYLKDVRPYLKKEDLHQLQTVITNKSWWDSVDALVKMVGYLAQKYPELKDQLVAWSVSDDIWLRRTSIISQLSMKDETDTALLEEAIANNLGSSEFFINKAIGCALRDYARSNEDWVVEFLTKYKEKLKLIYGGLI